jgi:hypothetical protein
MIEKTIADKKKEYQKKYYEANKEAIAAKKKTYNIGYYKINKEKKIAYNEIYIKKQKEKQAEIKNLANDLRNKIDAGDFGLGLFEEKLKILLNLFLNK